MALYQPAPLPFIAELTLIVLYRTEPFISSLFGRKKQLVPLQQEKKKLVPLQPATVKALLDVD